MGPAEEVAREEMRKVLAAAVEDLVALHVHIMLAVQLQYMEIQHQYHSFTRNAVLQSAYFALLRLEPTTTLTAVHVATAEHRWRALVEPYRDAVVTAALTREPMWRTFGTCPGPLLVLDEPVLHLGGPADAPGSQTTNALLARLGSPLRVREIQVGTETQLLLAEPNWPRCDGNSVFVHRERARTALLPYQLSSTQDVGGPQLTIYRSDAHAFLAHNKWNTDTIVQRVWDAASYGPTQKVVLALWRAHPDFAADPTMVHLATTHLQESSRNYQVSESRFSAAVLSPPDRGLLHGLASHFQAVEDIHTLLVDTLGTRLNVSFVAKLALLPPPMATIRLLMYVTDVWFGVDRVYMAGALSMLLAALQPGRASLDSLLLAHTISPRVAALLTDLLADLCVRARHTLTSMDYQLNNIIYSHADMSTALRAHYAQTKPWEPGSLEYEASYWTTVVRFALDSPGATALFALVADTASTFLAQMAQLAHLPVQPPASLAYLVPHILHAWDSFMRHLARDLGVLPRRHQDALPAAASTSSAQPAPPAASSSSSSYDDDDDDDRLSNGYDSDCDEPDNDTTSDPVPAIVQPPVNVAAAEPTPQPQSQS
mgnify:CR=1 FL=1